ncbi:MAG: hypothetical protein JST87_04355 [Bacteroidetes bacterium]|nr:hypothetical protein [Bacteroidota bacterium]
MKKILFFIYTICIALLAAREFKSQEFNWDMIPYMTIVASYDGAKITDAHNFVYNTIKLETPNNNYQLLTDGNIELRKRCAENATYLKDQLPYYIIKPLYTLFAYCAYKTGFSLTHAVLLPSVISYFLTGILLFAWLKKYISFFITPFLCLSVMLIQPLTATANLSTPDCLASFLLLTAFYFLLEKGSVYISFIFLLLSVFARLDNIIPAVCFVSSFMFIKNDRKKIPLKTGSLFVLALCIAYLLVAYSATKYQWNIFYFPSFMSHLNPEYNIHSSFSFENYFAIIQSQIRTGLFFSNVILFLLLASALFLNLNWSAKKITFKAEELLIISLTAGIFIRFCLQPVIADRFYLYYYLFVLIALIKKLSQGHQNIRMAT